MPEDTDLLRAIQDERDSPPDMAAYLIDTEAWLATLPEKKRQIATGHGGRRNHTELAVKYGMTVGQGVADSAGIAESELRIPWRGAGAGNEKGRPEGRPLRLDISAGSVRDSP